VGVSAAIVAFGALLVVLPAGRAGAGTDPEALLRQARTASSTISVAGVVEVRWRDGDEVHVQRVGARSRAGTYVVGRGNNVAVGSGSVRWAADDGVASRWGRVDGSRPPRPGAAWHLQLTHSTYVAGRPTQVVAVRRAGGPVRARFYVDEISGLLVRRDVLSTNGKLLRSVRYTRLVTSDVAPAVPTVPSAGAVTKITTDVGDEFAVPERVGSGFRLLGRYQHPDGVVQLFYSDGLFSLSVFEQPGLVDWSSLPDGGRSTSVASERARWYASDAGSVVVWGRDGLALTGVSDAPPEALREAVADVTSDSSDPLNDVIDFVLGPFGWD
jgi:sigma-E factor negative regulatory protein RseB